MATLGYVNTGGHTNGRTGTISRTGGIVPDREKTASDIPSQSVEEILIALIARVERLEATLGAFDQVDKSTTDAPAEEPEPEPEPEPASQPEPDDDDKFDTALGAESEPSV